METIESIEQKAKAYQVRTGLEWVNTIDDACDKRYLEEYAHGEYCHEQSFRWGFQEGVDWLEKQGKKIDAIENFDTEFEKQVSCLIASSINKEHEYNEGFVKWAANALLNYAKHELEKQGEHANFRNKIQIGDIVTRNQDGVLVNLSQLQRVAKPAKKQGEQKDPCETCDHAMLNCINFPCYEWDAEKKELKKIEQKPTEDEDREYACQSPEHYTRRELMIYNLGIANGKRMIEDAIKETKQNPAWSEEDENILNDCIKCVAEGSKSSAQNRGIIDWLKSLKERMKGE